MLITSKNEGEKGKGTGTDNCITVPQDDVIIKICEGIYKLRDAKPEDPYMQNRLSVIVCKDENIHLDLPPGKPPPTRISQVLLFQFILYNFAKIKCNEVEIDVSEYFSLRGIARRKSNLDALHEDLNLLSCLSLSLKKSIRGKSSPVAGSLLEIIGYRYGDNDILSYDRQYGKQLKTITIRLLDWSDNIKRKQFVYLSKELFRRNGKSQATVVMMSLKLGQLVRSNYNSFITSKQRRYKVSEILRFLGVLNKTVCKQGYTYYLDMLQDLFLMLKAEGYDVEFESKNNIKCCRDFLSGNILYANPQLQEIYSTIKKVKS